MGGTDALKGFDYQITYSILRIIELLIQDAPNSTEIIFESLNEEEEDFNILNGTSKEFIQLKKRIEGNHWTPIELKEIFSKFLQKADNTTKFHFVTNGTGNPDVIKLKKAIASRSKPEKELLDKITPEGKSESEILSLLDSTQISTRYGISDNDDDPAKVLRNECLKLLNSYPFFLNGIELEIIYNSVWKLVFDYSREGKKVTLNLLKSEFNNLGLKIADSPWTTQIQITEFTGRNNELQNLKEFLREKQAICINGINGIGKTWTTLKLLSDTSNLEKMCWVSITQWTSIENILFAISSFLFNAKKPFLANKVNTQERVHQIPAILQSMQELEYVLVLDSLNSGNSEIKKFASNLLEQVVNNEVKAKVIVSSTETVYIARTKNEKSKFQEFNLTGFELKETKIILSELSDNFSEEDIIRFHNSVGGHPMSIFFLKDLYSKNDIDKDTVTELGQKSIEECRDYILKKSIMTLDEESKNILLSLSVFKGEIDWDQCEAQIDSILNAKTALYPLLTNHLMFNVESGVNMHDSIRAVCQTIISSRYKEELLKKAIDYIFNKMHSGLEGSDGVLYEDLIKWSDLLGELHSMQSLEEKYKIIFDFTDEELDALWAIRRYGYPFDYETEGLSFSEKLVSALTQKGYVKDNDDPERVKYEKELIYDLTNLDYWQECLITALCLSKGISNHMGYIPIFKENHAFYAQMQICWWEHCIEYMPLPPTPRSERIEHQEFVKKKYENGDYSDKTEEQLEFLLGIINEKIPNDVLDEPDLEMEESSCPIFGHCCPGGKEQAQECRKHDDEDE